MELRVSNGNIDAIQIAFCAEGDYLPHAAAMLDSLLVSNPGERFAFHLLQGTDLDIQESHRLESWLRNRGVMLNRIHLDEDALRTFRSSQYFHRSIWYRVLLPELLPQLPKVLYLDADALVIARLRPLWETELSGHLFAAVVSPVYPFLPNWPEKILDIPAGRYLNSGVMLLNLERMREEGCVEALRNYSRSCPEVFGGTEQDALAALYHQRCLFLHPRWNVQTSFYELRLHELPVNRADVLEARRNPAIVHFTDPAKPSHYLCRHPYRDAYLRHRQATPWPLAKPEGRTWIRMILRRMPYRWVIRLIDLRNRLLRRSGQARAVTQ